MRKALIRRVAGVVAAFVLVGAPLAIATAAFADAPSAQSTATVSNGLQLRNAWGDTGNTLITLTADISLGQAPDACAGVGSEPFRAAGGSGVVIDGQGLFGITETCELARVLRDDGTEPVTLRGLTHFTGGEACGAGGGLYANGPVLVQNSTVSDNAARGETCPLSDGVSGQATESDAVGGGVYSGAIVDLETSTFTGNHADLAGGGFAAVLDTSVRGSSFSENTAGVSGTPGGADTFSGAGFATLGSADVAGSTFTGNSFDVGKGPSPCSGCTVAGGGFWAVAGALVDTSTFTENLADCEAQCTGLGGGFTAFGAATITGSTFAGNNAGCDGECTALGGAVFAPAVDISGSTFDQNRAGCSSACENVGGAVFTGNVGVRGSSFTGNLATCSDSCEAVGGAIGFGNLAATSTAFAPRAQESGTAWGGTPVSAAVVSNGSIDVSGSTFSGNVGSCDSGFCGADGGAIFAFDPTAVGITTSTFDHNTALYEGGAVSVQVDTESPTVTITNSTVTQNTSGQSGALDLGDEGVHTVLAYDTIVQNIASAPAPTAAVVIPASLTASSLTSFATIVALGIDGPNCDVPSNFESQGYNFSDDGTCGFDQATDKVATPNDPGLGALTANGGPTQTMLPQPGSPVLDAVPVATCQTGVAAGIAVDQRGITRPQGAGCDIGAVEVVVETPTPAPAVVITPKFTG